MKNLKIFIRDLKNLNKNQRIKVLLLTLLLIIVLIFSVFAAIIISIISKTPTTDLESLTDSFNQSSYIYSKEGNVLEKIESLEYRTLIDIEDIPKNVQNAFVSIEDHRFYKHSGLDPIGIASSIVSNIKSGALVRGGSTITQQLVRSVYLSNQKTLGRKIQEAYLALRVEDEMTKSEILEAYLNRINLGQGAYGIEAACQTYFSKDVDEINTAEAALLAGIPKSPTNYPPFKSVPGEYLQDDFNIIGTRIVDGEELYLVLNKDAFERQKVVLNRMYELGYIDSQEYERAKNYDILSSLNPKNFKNHNMSSYSTDYIKKEASKYLASFYKTSIEEGEHKLFTGGYKVYSTIDENLQGNLESRYEEFKNFLANKTSSGGARMLNLSIDEFNNIIYDNEVLYLSRGNFLDDAFNFIIPKDLYNISSHGDLKINSIYFKKIGQNIDIIDAYLIDDNKILNTFEIGNLQVEDGSFELKNDYLIIDGSFLKKVGDFYSIDENKNLIISKDYYNYNEKPVIQPQSAMIVANNENGFVEGIIGGLDVNSKNAKILNRATDSYRQPGSILTPFTVYLPALQSGKTLASVYDDVPLTVDGNFWPKNYYNSFKGLMTIRRAMENSSNVIAAEILQEIGIDKSMEILKSFDIIKANDDEDFFVRQSENSKKHDENLDALALGNMQIGLTLSQISEMYSTIANNGVKKEQTSILRIEDASGNIIIDNSKKSKKIIDEKEAFLLSDVLKTNSNRGNSRGINNSSTFASYLGQNKENSDYFISGFSPKYTISMWIGADSPKISISSNSNSIVELFNLMTRDIDLSTEFSEDPSYVLTRSISSKSGKLSTKESQYAGYSYREKFISGTEPTEYDDLFKKYLICEESNKIATQFCPSETVLYTVMFERPNGYDASKHYGIYPDDYMTIPKSYCDIHTREWVKENEEDENSNKDKKDSRNTKTKKDTKTTKKKS